MRSKPEKAYAEKLKHEIEGHQQYLNSVDVCTNRASEREEFQQVWPISMTISAKNYSK
ncbi:hypothetical protein [Mucilaginibacter lappiensis]|uniref:hypothetical protein n=1 Tax=Mucilaginibacter lappiensis TaxID=354630 RepID=UPI003D1AB78A